MRRCCFASSTLAGNSVVILESSSKNSLSLEFNISPNVKALPTLHQQNLFLFSVTCASIENIKEFSCLLEMLGLVTATKSLQLQQPPQKEKLHQMETFQKEDGKTMVTKEERYVNNPEKRRERIVRSSSMSSLPKLREESDKWGGRRSDLVGGEESQSSRRCPVCKVGIEGKGRRGASWRWPLYSHLCRKHFSQVGGADSRL